MEQKNIKTLKIKNLNFYSTPSKKNKIIFNNTIDIPDNYKTSKIVNKSLNSFSFRSQKKNNFNKTLNVNNIESMNKILGRLTNLNNKLNQIKNRRKRNLKLLKSNVSKPKIMCKTETKNKYLLYMNDYYKNKLLLKKRKLENALSEEERKDNYNRFLNPDFLSFEKNDINHNEPSKHTKLTKIISIENYFESKKDEQDEKDNNSTIKNKNHENSRNSNQNSNLDINLDIEKKLSHKNSFNSEDIFIPQIIPPQKKEENKKVQKERKEQNIQNNNNNDLSNSFIIYQEHINYIKRIRENELLDLINRYKKSLQKNQLEEMSHIQRFVFPQELITYLIKMKKELIVDKFRTEYFNKLDRYNLNNILRLKAAKNKNIASRKFN